LRGVPARLGAGEARWDLGERLSPSLRSAAQLLLAAAFAAAAGALVVKSPTAGIGLVVLVGAAAVALRLTRLGAVELTLGALPWLVILDGLMPSLLKTFVATAAVLAMLWLAMPLRYARVAPPVVAILFIVLMVGNVIFATESTQYIQFAKYLIFPAAALAVLSRRGQEQLPRARNAVLGSCLVAMVAQLGIVAAGLGQTGTKYGIGEKLGYGRGIVHEMALTFVVVAAAGLVSSKKMWVQVSFFALGAVPAMLTGVRSALLALLIVMLIYILRLGLNRRALTLVVVIFAVAFASGAASVVQERFNQSAQTETSITSVGSDRGGIWLAAVTPWWNSGPSEWIFGTGLRSVEEVELRTTGTIFVGHSDLIEVGVQLGVLALAIWGLLWIALLRAPLENIVLVPLIVYALVNGSIEYVAPIALGLAFAAACRPPPGEALEGGLRAREAVS
jgi:cytochrome c oxidase subunit IV